MHRLLYIKFYLRRIDYKNHYCKWACVSRVILWFTSNSSSDSELRGHCGVDPTAVCAFFVCLNLADILKEPSRSQILSPEAPLVISRMSTCVSDNCTVIQVIEGRTHRPQHENLTEFNRIARRWLDGLPLKEKVAEKEEAEESLGRPIVEL